MATTFTLNKFTNKEISKFVDDITSTMPKIHGANYKASLVAVSTNGASEEYKIDMTYIDNEACCCKVGDFDPKFFLTIADAIAKSNNFSKIILTRNTSEDVVIPEGITCTINTNGYTLSNVTGHTITVNGTLTVNGDSKIINNTHGRAAVRVSPGGTAYLEKGIFDRPLERGLSTGDNGNSYYTIINTGNCYIGRKGASNTDVQVYGRGGRHSSLIENGWFNSTGKTEADTCNMVINSGTFVGGKNSVKNDELGIITINGGYYTDYRSAILNWNVMIINGGNFSYTAARDGISNAVYLPLGVGKLEINDITLDSGTVFYKDNYFSDDITIKGGTFNGDVTEYVDENSLIYKADNKYIVKKKTQS